MRKIIETTQFKRDFKKIAASGRYNADDFFVVVDMLAHDKSLPHKFRDHALIGSYPRANYPSNTLITSTSGKCSFTFSLSFSKNNNFKLGPASSVK